MPAPAASCTSAAATELRSTSSGAAAKHLEGHSAAAGQSGPAATLIVSTAGVVPGAPSSGAPGTTASEPRPTELGPPYFGRPGLAIEEKARAFDHVSKLVR